MFIDTHCHLNIMTGKEPDERLQEKDFIQIHAFIEQAQQAQVSTIINVGTSVAESLNSVAIAKRFESVYASVGIHPCDVTPDWQNDFKSIQKIAKEKEKNKIVAIGETGLD